MRVRLVGSLLLALAAGTTPQRTLRLGTLDEHPTKKVKRLAPLAAYLAERLGDLGYTAGRVVVTPDGESMARLLRRGRVDLFVDSAFPTLFVQHLAGTRLLLRRWKKGVPEYRALILVRADSPVQSLEDLQGRTIAFEDPYSTSAYFFARVELHRAGLVLVPRKAPGAPVPANRVGYVFSGDEETSLVWLLRRRVAAAALSDGDIRELARGRRDELRILAAAGPIPRHIVSVRRDLPYAVVRRIVDVLTHLHDTPRGRRLLARAVKTRRFDALTPANLACLRRARITLQEILRLDRVAKTGELR